MKKASGYAGVSRLFTSEDSGEEICHRQFRVCSTIAAGECEYECTSRNI